MHAPLLRRFLLVLALLLAQWGAYAHALEHTAMEPHGCALCVHGKHGNDGPPCDAAPETAALQPAAPVFHVPDTRPSPGARPTPPIRDPPSAVRS